MSGTRTLEEVTSWCQKARVGDKKMLVVDGELSQADASVLAGEINAGRSGHVWISVVSLRTHPKVRTRLDVRCSN